MLDVPWVAKQGKKTPVSSSNFQKQWLFSEKGIHTKLGHFFSYALFSRNKENQRDKISAYASRYFSDYAPVLDACFPQLIQYKLCLMFSWRIQYFDINNKTKPIFFVSVLTDTGT